MEKIKGIIDSVIFEKDGFNIISIKELNNINVFTATVNGSNVFKDLTFEFHGEWVTHKKFGRQFKVSQLFEIKPETATGLERYLTSKLFPGIGPSIAKKIVKHYGADNVIKSFDDDIDSLINIDGISKNKLKGLKIAWKKNRTMADVLLFLHEHNITTNLSEKIYKEFGDDSIKILKENPYVLIKGINGVGFIKADEIALKLGLEEDSIIRVEAAILYTLNDITNSGHCFLKYDQLTACIEKLLNNDKVDTIDMAIDNLIAAEDIVKEYVNIDGDEQYIYYDKYIHSCEAYCGDKVNMLIQNDDCFSREKVSKLLKETNLNIGDEQEEAVINSISSKISILTGGPGTGKSFTLNAILKVLNELGKTFVLTAPTGRAAQKMMDATGEEAKTIHRLLGWDFMSGKFETNEANPIEEDFLIVDESSMIDVKLASSLLKATHHTSNIIFIGDIDQLPPVGPGNFFKDLIKSGEIKISRLTKIYRQGEGSNIISFSHDINNKIIPDIPSPFENPNIWNEGGDCLFIDSDYVINENTPKHSSLRYGRDVNKMIKELYSKIIPKYLGVDAEIQVLCPLKTRGGTSVIELNKQLQQAVNPLKYNSPELVVFNNLFRVNDRVMQTKNNYQIDVFNGDIGVIKSIDKKNYTCIVEYQNEKKVLYTKGILKELELARACSIHKSQGSEYDCVIIPILNEHYIMLYNSLIYTALTRAKKLAVFVGSRDALKIAINNFKPNMRQTRLAQLIKR